eukprot:COSAG02_NODE_3264_length_7066_cov_91.385101_4_plen_45_part_00
MSYELLTDPPLALAGESGGGPAGATLVRRRSGPSVVSMPLARVC